MGRPKVSYIKLACVLGLLSYSCGLGESQSAKNGGNKICKSQTCIDIGDEVINNRDESVEPCENFYKHACGQWGGIVNVPVTQMVRLFEEISNLTQEIASDQEPPKDEAMRKFRDYHVACMNYDKIEADGLKPLASIVNKNGGWPLAQPSSKRSANDGPSLGTIHENYAKIVESPALFAIRVNPIDIVDASGKRSGVHMLHLTLPDKKTDFVASRELAHESEYVAALAKEFAALEGSSVRTSDINDQVESMLDFGKSLKKLDSKGDAKKMTLGELQGIWNEFVGGRFLVNFREIIGNAFSHDPNVKIDWHEPINLVPGNIVEQLSEILQNRDAQDVVNYVHYDAISSLAPFAGEKMLKIFNSSVAVTFDDEELADLRSMQCSYYHKMLDVLSSAYIEKYVKKGLRPVVMDMAKEIQREMQQQIAESNWMDDVSKAGARKKIAGITKNIEYPAFYENPGLSAYYSDLKIDDKNYLRNVMNYYGFARKQNLKQLRKPYEPAKLKWAVSPLAVTPPEKIEYNSIIIPATHLQRPYFDAEIQEVLNYGALGSVIGREMARAFDSQGINLDDRGFHRQTWSDKTLDLFNERLHCFVNQYGASSIIGENDEAIQIDGKKTLDGNFADYFGARVALGAYRGHKNAKGNKNIKIKSLINFSDEQLFFYSFGQSLCGSAESYTKNDEHAPASVRVNGVVSNMPEFAKAFQCKTGSPMNPRTKCDLQ